MLPWDNSVIGPGEGPSRGLLRDYEIFGEPSFEALIDSIAVIALYPVLT